MTIDELINQLCAIRRSVSEDLEVKVLNSSFTEISKNEIMFVEDVKSESNIVYIRI